MHFILFLRNVLLQFCLEQSMDWNRHVGNSVLVQRWYVQELVLTWSFDFLLKPPSLIAGTNTEVFTYHSVGVNLQLILGLYFSILVFSGIFFSFYSLF